ncbi:MAG: ATP-dependent Clp protease proteolytic subunit [bacterium]
MKKLPKKTGEQIAFPDEFFARELHINGRINCTLYESLKKALRVLNKKKGYIIIYIESGGGDFFAAKKIYQLFKTSRNPVIGIAERNISSVAAMLVLQGCKYRLISAETKMFLHNIKQTVAFEYVPYQTHKKLSHGFLAEEFKKAEGYQDFVYEVLIDASSQNKEEVARILLEEKILLPAEIIKFGFADRII